MQIEVETERVPDNEIRDGLRMEAIKFNDDAGVSGELLHTFGLGGAALSCTSTWMARPSVNGSTCARCCKRGPTRSRTKCAQRRQVRDDKA